MSFTKANITIVRNAIENALRQVEQQHNIKLEMGNIRYSDGTFTSKLTGLADVTNVADVERKKFEAACWKVGLQANQYGTEFVTGNGTFKLVGVNPRAKKYPIIGLARDGKRFKFPTHVVSGQTLNVTQW